MGLKVRMSWKPGTEPDKVVKNYTTAFLEYKRAQLTSEFEKMLPEITEWMKEHAPWEDRTGRARKSLRAMMSRYAKTFLVVWFTYGPNIDYAHFLEEMQAGRFSILPQTQDYWLPKIYNMMLKVYSSK